MDMGVHHNDSEPTGGIAARLCIYCVTAVLFFGFSGCGYSSKSLYNKSVTTVAVPIFTNKTFRREWEFRLTEAVDKNIEGAHAL